MPGLVATKRFSLKQRERLKHKKLIDALFGQGTARRFPPIRVIYLHSPVPLSSHQVLFSVPKKRVKRATDRNKLKRRMREAYRLNRHCLATDTTNYLLIGYIYTGSAIPSSFSAIEQSMIATLRHLDSVIQQPPPS